MVRRCDLARRQRKRKSRTTRMTANPATPPTTPPTTAGVFVEFWPPDPAPELAVDDGAEPVLLGPPTPPAAPPVLDAKLDGLDEDNWVLEAANDEKVVREAVELPAVEATSEFEVRLEALVEVREALLVEVERDLIEVISVLFELRLENTGVTMLGPMGVVFAPE